MEKELTKDEYLTLQKGKVRIIAELHDHKFLAEDAILKRAMNFLKKGNLSLIQRMTERIRALKLHRQIVS